MTQYLNENGEIDEDLVREDLVTPAWQIEDEIAERVEHALLCERVIVNDQGEDVTLPEEEVEAMRDTFEAEIRDEVEEEYEDGLEEVVRLKMRELEQEREYEEDEDGEEGE